MSLAIIRGSPRRMETVFIIPCPTEWLVTLPSRSHHQSTFPVDRALVLIYVCWHAISCSITFTCQTVNHRWCTVMGENSILSTWLVYLHGDTDSGWAKDIVPSISMCCHVSAVNVHHIRIPSISMRRRSYSRLRMIYWENNPLLAISEQENVKSKSK